MDRRDMMKAGVALPLIGSLAANANANETQSTAPSTTAATRPQRKAYDYIIVGGGTAGPVLAARLSEDPTKTVLLLEAGKENTKEAMGYVNGAGAMWAPDTNWGYKSTPQAGLKNRNIMLPRGKVVGGSASINVGTWSRGCAGNYDSWGLPGWDWETVLKWYIKIEDSDRGANQYRGGDGPMKLEITPAGTFMTDVFRKASIEAGVGTTEDLNGESIEGFDNWQCIFKNGRRHNTVKNYLDDARLRPNLAIATGAFVNKVNVERGVATGVECEHNGQLFNFKANAEVILCAGTYATPKVLMLSGIGPARYLNGLGIAVVHDLPGVGQNLGDHLRTDFGVMSPDGVGASLRGNPKDPAQLEEWRRTGYGPLSVAENTSAAFCKSAPDAPVPDIELMFNINAPMQYGSPPPKNNGYHISVGLVQPVSRGSIQLASKDPKESLMVDPGYLSDDRDIERYIKGMRIAMKYPTTESLKGFTDLSTVSIKLDASDAELAEYIRSKAESIYHPIGTSKMGRDDDPTAVVNTKLQVRGIKNLRVADASVIPNLITGHTMAPTILVAERLADFIKSGV